MDAQTLAALPSTRSLESSDRERLHRLRQRPLPAVLGRAAEWTLAHDRKGELSKRAYCEGTVALVLRYPDIPSFVSAIKAQPIAFVSRSFPLPGGRWGWG